MRDEQESDRAQLCHAQSPDGNCGSIHGDGVPDEDWCALTTDIWWGAAIQFPDLALRQIALADRAPSRGPGLECPVPNCRDHYGDGPAPQPWRVVPVRRSARNS